MAAKISGLDISGDNEIYISAEEASSSDLEGRRGSILRKKSFEEKKTEILHGILKAPSEDNPSRTPPSILKHRESSEEKETWLQGGDLHSILKKSTSEEESCNSGSDVIRPILKVRMEISCGFLDFGAFLDVWSNCASQKTELHDKVNRIQYLIASCTSRVNF